MSKPTVATYYGAKIAFQIPKRHEVMSAQAWEGKEIPDGLIDELFALFPGEVEFVTEDICSPHLLVVDIREPLTSDLIKSMECKIRKVLARY